MRLGTGSSGIFELCMLVFMAYLSALAAVGLKEVPNL